MYASLTYRDVRAAAAWLNRAFGFTADLDGDGVGVLRHGADHVIVQPDRPDELHGSHIGLGWVYGQVDDIDAHYRRAVDGGAQVLGAPHDAGDGHRGFSARDLEGNLWSFGTGPAD